MQHCDADVLTLAALGEDIPASDRTHLDSCGQCSAELADLSRVVAIGRSAATEGELVAPPAGLWEAIDHGVRNSSDTADARVIPLDRARSGPRRRWLPLMAAAAVGAVLGGVVTTTVTATRPPSVDVVASASLQPVTEGGRPTAATGSAAVERSDAGMSLAVTTADLETVSGYYEVWLIDPDTFDMVSLGTIASDRPTVDLPVPTGLPMDRYSVVDISDEPLDGDPAHSKVSVLRGQLPSGAAGDGDLPTT